MVRVKCIQGNVKYSKDHLYFLIHSNLNNDLGENDTLSSQNGDELRVGTAKFVIIPEEPAPTFKEVCPACEGLGWVMIDVGQLEDCYICKDK